MKQKIISLIFSILASIAFYIHFTIADAMCYYSVGIIPSAMSDEVMEAIRNKCHEQFSLENIIPQIIFVFIISFLALYGFLHLVFEWRKKKSIT
jgi:small basic protein